MSDTDLGQEQVTGGYYVTPSVKLAAKRKQIPSLAVVVHGQIRQWMNEDRADMQRSCWSGIERISEELGLSRRSVLGYLKALEEVGFIHRKKRYMQSDLIWALDSPTMWNSLWGTKPKGQTAKAKKWVISLDSQSSSADCACADSALELEMKCKKCIDEVQNLHTDSNYDLDLEKITTNTSTIEIDDTSSKVIDASKRPIKTLDPIISDHVANLCVGMADHVTSQTGKEPKISKAWQTDMRLLTERGPTDWADPEVLTFGEVASMIRWVSADSFWKANVLSPGTLRKQWSKLAAAKSRGVDKESEPQTSLGMKESERRKMAKDLGQYLRAQSNGEQPVVQPLQLGAGS